MSKKKDKFPVKGLSSKEKFFISLMRGNAEQAEGLLFNMSLTSKDAINTFDENGNVPIHIAAAHGRLEACKMLVKHNCDINAKTDPNRDKSELRTALHHAAASGRIEVCRYLLAHGADPHAIDAYGKKPVFMAWDTKVRQQLLLGMEAATNITLTNDLLVKAQAAKQVFIEFPNLNIVSPHPVRLKITWEAWKREFAKLQKDHGVIIPMHKPPTGSYIVATQADPHVGMFVVMDKKSDANTKNPFTGVIRVDAKRMDGQDVIAIKDIYIRQDARRGRAGCVLLLHVLREYAQLQYYMAYAVVHHSNHPAQAFFAKTGFRKMNKESVPKHVKKHVDKSFYFEMRHIGVQLSRLEGLLSQYQNVQIIHDEVYMEEEEEKVHKAIKERELERQRRRETKGTEDGKEKEEFLDRLYQRAGLVKVEASDSPDWWTKPPPIRNDGKPLLKLPRPSEALRAGPPLLHPDEGPELLPESWAEEIQATRHSYHGVGLPQPKTAGLDTMRHSSTELDRVPDFVLKEYKKNVLNIRMFAEDSIRSKQRFNGGRSRILRDLDTDRRNEFMDELDKFEQLNSLRRKLFVSDGVRSTTAASGVRPQTMRGELVSAHGMFKGKSRRHAMAALGFTSEEPNRMSFDDD